MQSPFEAAFYGLQISSALEGVETDGFDRLVLAAPAHALHDLREALVAQAASKVVGMFAKDLMKTPGHDLSRHLPEWRLPLHQPRWRC